MHSPKILQIPERTIAFRRTALGASLLAASLGFFTFTLASCSGGRAPDSPARAEKRAVSLANDRYEKEFGKRPFKTGRFPATRSGERWLWGWLDAADGHGFTAQVSFRTDGSEPEARIFSIAAEAFDMEAPDAPRLGSSPETDALNC